MEVRTGYFSYTKKYEEMGYFCVSIARMTPKFFKGVTFEDLAPSNILLARYKKGQLSNEEFAYAYINQIKYLPFDSIFNKLFELAKSEKSKGIVLLCYEKSDNFCHRHVLADYLNENFDMNISELNIN